MARLRRVLIANRGEIVARIARSCHAYGVDTAAIYSDADRGSPYIDSCDVAYAIGGVTSAESYLDIEAIIRAARATDCDAIHPGYGFVSENPALATACTEAGLVFVGPPAQVLAQLGDKATAKGLARDAGVPVVPGYEGDDQGESALAAAVAEIGFPALLKASAGGGGKGMRVVREDDDLTAEIAAAKREASSSFGDPRLIVERYIERPRHIEIQILADDSGRVVHLGERECSIQRRHQKIIEEAPSPAIDDSLRQAMGAAAIALAERVGYRSAGTVEFILDEDKSFYFLEVNARLQVEHGVTELVTGVDIVREQLRIAEGKMMALTNTPPIRGHAIEARLYAEDPNDEFLPRPGTLLDWRPPTGADVRIDAALAPETIISPHYDPMIAKLLVIADDRERAIGRLRRCLDELWCPGLITNQDLLAAITRDEAFIEGELSTHYLEERRAELFAVETDTDTRTIAIIAALLTQHYDRSQHRSILPELPLGFSNNSLPPPPCIFEIGDDAYTVVYRVQRDGSIAVNLDEQDYLVRHWRMCGDRLELELGDGRRFTPRVLPNEHRVFVALTRSPICVALRPRFSSFGADEGEGTLTAPMPGKVIDVLVSVGDRVEAGETIAILEAMKMEHRLVAATSGIVREIVVGSGDQVGSGQRIAIISEE